MGRLRLSIRAWNTILGLSLLTDPLSGMFGCIWLSSGSRKNYHTATKLTPFEALYGTTPFKLLDYILGITQVAGVDSVL